MNFNSWAGKRRLALLSIDFITIIVAFFLSFFTVNLFFHIPVKVTPNAVGDGLVLMLFMLGGMIVVGSYNSVWRYARIMDFFKMLVGVIAGSVIFIALYTIFQKDKLETIVALTVLNSIIGIVVTRMCYYLLLQAFAHSKNEELPKKKLLIVGAGECGNKLVNEIAIGDDAKYTVVGFVDDNSEKIGRNIGGVKVIGPVKDIPKIVEKYGVEVIFIAMPSVSASDKRRVISICAETVCDVRNIPNLGELIANHEMLSQTKKISVEDLLGRDVIKFDSENSKQFIRDKVCLVTGGGGSIGSELCRQIIAYEPKKLVILDIYENNAYDIQQELSIKYGKSINMEVYIASVRDYDKMCKVFEEIKPDLVFHAAAHKHVPLMENDPEEAIKNNVRGTLNCAKLAKEFGVEKFVLVSTDKAVNPTNVMGATKRCCEMIVQYFAQQKNGTEYVAVRFGNVLGSNGSVIPLFERQISEGGPITVTHPDIIRYFMTIPEAVALILQAGAMARGGEIFVLDMGEPVKILSLAENLIRLHGKEPYKDIDIKFSGLRPGEKLFEELLMAEEGLKKTENNKIFIGNQIDVDGEKFMQQLDEMFACADSNNSDDVVSKLREVVPTFNHVVLNKN